MPRRGEVAGPLVDEGAMHARTDGHGDRSEALRRVEARGAIETAHRIKDACGQVFRFAIALPPSAVAAMSRLR